MEPHDLLAGVGILAGLVGIVIVFLPGLLLVLGSVLFWAWVDGTTTAWAVFVLALVVSVAVSVLKYVHPGRRLREAGVPGWHLVLAVVCGIVGLFIVPVVGAPLGFVGGLYLLALPKAGSQGAWVTTKKALSAVAQSIGIELAGGFLILVLFVGGVLLT